MTLIDLMAIALRYTTAMSDALIDACIERHEQTGEPLFEAHRRHCERSRGARPDEDIDWERMVTDNREVRFRG